MLTTAVLLELGDMLIEFVEVLSLGCELLFEFPEARRSVRWVGDEEGETDDSISFWRMNMFSDAASRLLKESLCETVSTDPSCRISLCTA